MKEPSKDVLTVGVGDGLVTIGAADGFAAVLTPEVAGDISDRLLAASATAAGQRKARQDAADAKWSF